MDSGKVYGIRFIRRHTVCLLRGSHYLHQMVVQFSIGGFRSGGLAEMQLSAARRSGCEAEVCK